MKMKTVAQVASVQKICPTSEERRNVRAVRPRSLSFLTLSYQPLNTELSEATHVCAFIGDERRPFTVRTDAYAVLPFKRATGSCEPLQHDEAVGSCRVRWTFC